MERERRGERRPKRTNMASWHVDLAEPDIGRGSWLSGEDWEVVRGSEGRTRPYNNDIPFHPLSLWRFLNPRGHWDVRGLL
jgi:hypothetical protein